MPTRSFATLMELYESNYIQLRRLIPRPENLGDSEVSHVPGGVDLHLSVIERAPYTTTLALTHYFEGGEPEGATPDLRVRIYHDARTAEVMPDTDVDHFELWDGKRPQPKTLSWRWELNRFLNRWLTYCLAEGHGFARSAGDGRICEPAG